MATIAAVEHFIVLVLITSELGFAIKSNFQAEAQEDIPGINSPCVEAYFTMPPLSTFIPNRLVPEALELAKLSSNAYRSCSELLNGQLLESFTLRKCLHDRATDTQGFIATDDDSVVIAFRGSQEPQDYFTDLDAKSVYFGNGEHCQNKNYRCVHQGFYEAYKSIYDDSLKVVRIYARPEKNIYITGHSLGGAIATLVTYSLSNDLSAYRSQMHMFTFGSLPVGNTEFINRFSSDHPIGSSNVITIIGDGFSYEYCTIGATTDLLSNWFDIYHKPATVYYLPERDGHLLIFYIQQLQDLYDEQTEKAVHQNGHILTPTGQKDDSKFKSPSSRFKK